MLFQLSMYFLSFFPLWISVLFMDGLSIARNTENLYTEWLSIIAIVVGLAVALAIMRNGLNGKKQDDCDRYELKESEEEKFITAEFLMSYIFPLFAFDFTVWDQVVLFLIFFLLFGFLCVRHNYFCVNIILDMQRYRIYRCTLENEDGKRVEKKVISRRVLKKGIATQVYFKALNNDYGVDCCTGQGSREERVM